MTGSANHIFVLINFILMALLSIAMAGCVSQNLDTLMDPELSHMTGRAHQFLNKFDLPRCTDSLQKDNYIGPPVYCCGRSCQSNIK